MAHYAKGANAERELIEMFWNSGYAAMRAAGSGISRLPSADVIASNGEKTFAISCKATKKANVYLDADELKKLRRFAHNFGAIPLIGVRFNGKNWYFIEVHKLKTTKGKKFAVSKKIAQKSGKSFEKLVKKEIFFKKR